MLTRTRRRIPSPHVEYHQTSEKRYITFAFVFDLPDDEYFFAYCYPYTYEDLGSFLNECSLLAPSIFRRDRVGMSVEHRPIEALTITEAPQGSPVIVVTSRVHPGETPASFTVEGLIRYLLSNFRLAVALRKHYDFRIVPMLNPDGVQLGNSRCCSLGLDLNRCWQKPTMAKHPTIRAVKDYLNDLAAQSPIVYFVDIHAHSGELNHFLYGNSLKTLADVNSRNTQQYLQKSLHLTADDFSIETSKFNVDAKKVGTARRAIGQLLNSPESAFTLEVSFYGKFDKKTDEIRSYVEGDYRKIGENFARALHICLERVAALSF